MSKDKELLDYTHFTPQSPNVTAEFYCHLKIKIKIFVFQDKVVIFREDGRNFTRLKS